MKVDTAGYVYVADSTFRIRKFDPSGTLQKTYDIAAATGITGSVYDMAFDSSGNMYVATSSTTTPILKYSLSGTNLNWTTATTIGTAKAVAVDISGNLLVLDSSALQVLQFNPSGTLLASWTGQGTPATGTVFGSVGGITVDRYGNIYVTDTTNKVIKEYTPSGGYSASLTPPGVTLSGPTGISVDTSSTPTFYIADGGDHVVKTNWSSSSPITGFVSISNAAVDNSGNVYAADAPTSGPLTNAGRVQKFNSSGTLLAAWGGAALTGNGQLSRPALRSIRAAISMSMT